MPILSRPPLPRIACFVTATGTGVGKTFVSRALTLGLCAQGKNVAAIKPLETGWPSSPSQAQAQAPTDAALLARACAKPELENAAGLYRVAPPLSPYAATLTGAAPPPSLDALALTIASLAQGCDALVIEGAGGVLVPLDREHTFADLITALDVPVLIVAPNALGVLSHVLTAVESLERRGVQLSAVVLSEHAQLAQLSSTDDPSRVHNRVILQERLRCPVLAFPHCDSDDRALAAAALSSGLIAQVSEPREQVS